MWLTISKQYGRIQCIHVMESTIQSSIQPMVSICTPTFNRRPFMEMMIRCFEHQTYPSDRMEWIVIDDGTDHVGDLLTTGRIKNMKYFSYAEKMELGRKRNLMHDKCTGDIIVYMDDDDFYPPERVSHAVETLLANPTALCAGSSRLCVWFNHINRMVQFGPYGPNHATAGTFAFRRQMLEHHRYDDNISIAEERDFLANYTVPFVQLDPMKTILVVSHAHNSFDKKLLLNSMDNNTFQKYSTEVVEDYTTDPFFIDFFTNSMDCALDSYAPGRPEMKPGVMKQVDAKLKAVMSDPGNVSTGVRMNTGTGKSIVLTRNQVVDMVQRQNDEIARLKTIVTRMTAKIGEMHNIIEHRTV